MDVAALEGELARLRRRGAELEALYSTARELVRLQDVDEVLSRLVQRAHGLMGTDVTYLSEMLTGGDLRVRHSVGTVTPEFRDLHVPAGMGLASKVVTTRAPAWVSDYPTMREAPHDVRIDAAVEAEGLVSFLGVPLAVGDEVLGALFACNRFAHEYSPEEVLLLSAFADHAAAVLHNARVSADREAAYRRLEQASAIHEELAAAVISGGSVVDLVSTVSRRLGRPVWALDEDARPLLAERSGLPARSVLADAATRSHARGKAEAVETGGKRWHLVAIPGADRVTGSILAAGDDDELVPVLERAAQVAALVSLKREAVNAIGAERRATELLELLDGRRAPDETSLDGPITASAVIDVGGRGLAVAVAVAVAAAGDDGLVAQRNDQLIVAWSVPDFAERTERVRRVIAERLREAGVTAVVAPAGESIAATVDRAARDLRFLPSLGISGGTTASESFAPYHALTSADPGAAQQFVQELIGSVMAWDEQRGTQLFETLVAYFGTGESRSDAAAQLHIHKNTVQQRLERVEQLLPGSWADAEFRFRVHAAVRLESLRRSLRAGP